MMSSRGRSRTNFGLRLWPVCFPLSSCLTDRMKTEVTSQPICVWREGRRLHFNTFVGFNNMNAIRHVARKRFRGFGLWERGFYWFAAYLYASSGRYTRRGFIGWGWTKKAPPFIPREYNTFPGWLNPYVIGWSGVRFRGSIKFSDISMHFVDFYVRNAFIGEVNLLRPTLSKAHALLDVGVLQQQVEQRAVKRDEWRYWT